MKRRCPNCGRREVPNIKFSVFGEAASARCSNCLSQIEVSQFKSFAIFFLVNISMFGFLLLAIELNGVIGGGGVAWWLMETVRSFFLPLKASKTE